MIPVAFDLRDPDRSGIARVARSLAHAFVAGYSDEFSITLAGPVPTLESLGATGWNSRPPRLLAWNGKRYSLAAEAQWSGVRRKAGRDTAWYFPHWDVPWHDRPERYVVTIHDVGHLRLESVHWTRRRVARSWMGRSGRGARAVTCVTRFSADEVATVWPGLAARTRVVPNGVEESFFQPAGALPGALAARLAGEPYLLSVGIRKRHKNLAVVVDVLARVPNVSWVVVGEWFPDWEEVAARADERGVRDRVIVLERQTDAELRSLYAHAVCLMFPSRYEGFGLPILESLAAGTPVVVSGAPASVETLGGCGWICDADDAEQFANAVREVMDLGTRRAEFASRGRERARQFTWGRSAGMLADILRSA